MPKLRGIANGLVWVLVTLATQSVESRATIPPDVPLVNRPGVGTRALGMGGASVGVSEDYHALAINPAGLAQLRRVEFGLEFKRKSITSDATYLGETHSVPLDKTRIQSIGFAYPFPTYRGALVVGMSYQRVADLDQDYYRAGRGGEIQSEVETIFEEGSVGAYQAGFAVAASPKLNLGATATFYSGGSDRERSFTYRSTNGIDRERTNTTQEMDIHAISGSLGALVQLRPDLRLGLSLHLPESFTLEGSGDDDIVRVGTEPPDTLDILEPYTFSDELTLPARFSAGLAWTRNGWLASADAAIADWKQIDYYGPLRTEEREYVYRTEVDLRLGVEYTFPNTPLRLRAGYASQPVAYRPIATDVFRGEFAFADFEQDRRTWSFGGSVLLEESMMLEAAYVTGGYERRGRSPRGVETIEKLDQNDLLVGVTFRL
ncbi:MAG: hypothetical protein IT349_13755 [Candidatus Eisenbacteria bacterium]|nr:hypothetical protein [Candidatus Eisenbacteria bacterium]